MSSCTSLYCSYTTFYWSFTSMYCSYFSLFYSELPIGRQYIPFGMHHISSFLNEVMWELGVIDWFRPQCVPSIIPQDSAMTQQTLCFANYGKSTNNKCRSTYDIYVKKYKNKTLKWGNLLMKLMLFFPNTRWPNITVALHSILLQPPLANLLSAGIC